MAVGQQQRSQILIANAWHHRSDALSSVVALVGIAGSLLGCRILDPLAGIVVAGLVSWMGIRIGVESLSQLTDTSDYDMVERIGDIARGVPGVKGVNHIRCRSMGGSSLVDLAIQVDPMLSASCAHRLAEEVRWTVADKQEGVSEVLVHVDTTAHDVTCPLQDSIVQRLRPHTQVEEQVREKLLEIDEITSVPRVQVHYLPEGLAIEAQAAMLEDLTISELRPIADRARRRLLASATDISSVRIGLSLEPMADPRMAELAQPVP